MSLPPNIGPGLPPGLARKRLAARAALWFEQAWPAAWPAVGVLAAYAVAALLDLPALLPPWPRLLLPALILLLAASVLWRGVARMARPSAAAADRRLEQASGLKHRPLAALEDRAANPSAEAAAVWLVHQGRLRAQLRRLRVGVPRPGLARQDGAALRGLALVALVAALVIAGREAPARLWAGLLPGIPAGSPAPGTVVQAWVTPPAYTGLPPQFLQTAIPAVSVPAGSHLTVSVTGGRGNTPALLLDADETAFHPLDASSWQAERDLGTPGRLVVRRGGEALAAWTLAIIPDHPPTVAFTEPPGPAVVAGRPTTQTRLAWRAEDDYGVVSVQAEIRLRDRPEAPPLVVAAPLAGSPRQAHAATSKDLTAHPWAGLPVTARMVARDAAGQSGTSTDAPFDLPERHFQNPAAQAVIAIRKQLSRTPDERAAARAATDAVADRPELFQDNAGVLLNLRAIGSLLAHGRGTAAVDEAQARMWELALALEEGTPERTARSLEAARQAMRDAMEAARQDPKDATKQAELQQRLQELREAIERHIDALTEQARRDGTLTPFDPAMPQMNAQELDRMAERMEQAMREGRTDDAKQEMAELERLLEQLQNARPEHGEQREQRNAERRQQGRQQTDAVQDMVRREGTLLDHSRARAESGPQRPSAPSPASPAPQPPAPQRPGAAPGSQPPRAAQDASPREHDERAQKAMRRALGELMQRFGDLTGSVPAPLGEADVAMREAAEAAGNGQDGAAGAAQQRAIEALQKGGQQMGQQMARQFGRGQQPGEGEDGQGEGDGDGDGSQTGQREDGMGNSDGSTSGPRPGEQRGTGRRRTTRHDPLGRPLSPDSGRGESGESVDSDSVRVPDQMETARTRALQDELRRRGGERSRPQGELDYIDRLLKPF